MMLNSALKSAFNNEFRAGFHAVAYLHVTALVLGLASYPAPTRTMAASMRHNYIVNDCTLLPRPLASGK